ncbi:hypothetical protein D3C85_1551460 [compost metagenome]
MDVELGQHAEEGAGDVAGGVARPGRFQAGGDALDHGLLAVEEVLRRLAQVDGPRQRAVVALVAAGDLEEGASAALEGRVVPGQVRCAGVRAGG